MPLTQDHLRRIVRVLRAQNVGFVELVGLAELDPAEAFQGAVLRGADLRGQDLGGFDFSGADLSGVDLTGANLTWTRGVTAEMLAGAYYDSTTGLPATLADSFWSPDARPTWAERWGVDSYGRWVVFSVPAADGSLVTQRMRWISHGTFIIGSPDGEEGRFKDEGPQQKIAIAEGFWLFDTPCTQALWQAVMGDNPSRFRSPDRPVESVSFDDARRFIRKLNQRLPGVNLSLPSEAWWEYACRAGTTDATYAGPMEILGKNNAPVLDAIAWYGGNSGVEFELDNGDDSSAWPDKQYSHNKAGTHPVARKAPNQWGLYDMLGNVWEWCADAWQDSHDGIPLDGSPRTVRVAASRVIRGGCWVGDARSLRAACRAHDDPADRDVHLGFRCARVQVSVSSDSERRAGRSKPSERSERAATPGPQRRAR
jgi:formylglycine-generating enzyme required for sulfatase activity